MVCTLGPKGSGSHQAPVTPTLGRQKGQKDRREGGTCLTFPGREGRGWGLGHSRSPDPAGLSRRLGKESLPCGALPGPIRGVHTASVPWPLCGLSS